MKKTFISISAVAAFFATLALPLAVSAANVTTVVTPTNLNGWGFFNDQTDTPIASNFVNGPGTPPLGTGSAQLAETTPAEGYLLGKATLGGTKLSDLTNLEYSTYGQTGNNNLAPSMQLNIDPDGTDATTGWFGRLVYEPYYSHTVTDGVWQTWNTQDNAQLGGNGSWWFSNGTLASTTGCTQAAPCTWSEVLTVKPNISINSVFPGVGFKVGSNWNVPYTGNIDAFKIGTADNVTTYDFELVEPLPVAATNKDDCKNGGWMHFQTAYKNQGDCVSAVASNGKARGNPPQDTSVLSTIGRALGNLF